MTGSDGTTSLLSLSAPSGAGGDPASEDAPARPQSRAEAEREQALEREPDVLEAITRLREIEETRRVPVPVRREIRPGEYVDLGRFHILPLRGDAIERLIERCTVWRRDHSGKRWERVLDNARLFGWLVLEATDPDDRRRWWEDARVRERAGVASSVDVVSYVLGGQKGIVAAKVLEISGYDMNLEELLSSS